VSFTVEELKEKITQEYDEVTILEILDIKANELVEAFHDKIVERFDQLTEEFEIGS
jgi:hypothetical protein